MRFPNRFAVIFSVTLLFPTLAFAASPWTEGATYADKLRGKLDFGVKNLFAGWTEIVSQPWNAHKQGHSPIEGFGRGLVYFFADTIGGALHAGTFPITNLDIPLPENGVHFE